MLERWSPRAEVERLIDEVDRLVSETARRGTLLPRLGGFRMAMDLYETPDSLVIKALVPGLKPEDIDVALDQNVLTIRGRYGDVISEEEAAKVTWHCREIGSGTFSERVLLPLPVDPEQVSAAVEHGILTVTMVKTTEARAKRIPVHARAAS